MIVKILCDHPVIVCRWWRGMDKHILNTSWWCCIARQSVSSATLHGGLCWRRTWRPSSSHRCSKGFMSRDLKGQCSTVTLLACRKSCVNRAVWCHALTCWSRDTRTGWSINVTLCNGVSGNNYNLWLKTGVDHAMKVASNLEVCHSRDKHSYGSVPLYSF